MKTWKRIALAVTLGALVVTGLGYIPILAGQGPGGPPTQASDEDYTSVNVGGLKALLEELPLQPLSDEEKAGIIYVREEEKLAHDVYIALYEKWGLPIFANIAASESTHMAAMKLLIDRYGLDDPAKTEPGEFTNPELQKLYDDLVAKGNKSLVDALKVGATIEELDIVDIRGYLSKTDNEDIKLVYENLLKGSRNHLRAFVSTLRRNGVEYQPQFLSPEEYQEIITSPRERGNS